MDLLSQFRLRKLASSGLLDELLIKEAKQNARDNRRRKAKIAKRHAAHARENNLKQGAEALGMAEDASMVSPSALSAELGRRDLKQVEHAGILRRNEQTAMNQMFAPGRKNDMRNVSPALDTYWKGSGMSNIDRADFTSSAAYKKAVRSSAKELDKLKRGAAKRGLSLPMNQRVADVVRNTQNTGALSPNQMIERLRFNDRLPGAKMLDAMKANATDAALLDKISKLKRLKRLGIGGAALAGIGGLGYGAYKLSQGAEAVPAAAPVQRTIGGLSPEMMKTLGYTGGGALAGALAGGLMSRENKLRNALIGATLGGLGGYAADYGIKRYL